MNKKLYKSLVRVTALRIAEGGFGIAPKLSTVEAWLDKTYKATPSGGKGLEVAYDALVKCGLEQANIQAREELDPVGKIAGTKAEIISNNNGEVLIRNYRSGAYEWFKIRVLKNDDDDNWYISGGWGRDEDADDDFWYELPFLIEDLGIAIGDPYGGHRFATKEGAKIAVRFVVNKQIIEGKYTNSLQG